MIYCGIAYNPDKHSAIFQYSEKLIRNRPERIEIPISCVRIIRPEIIIRRRCNHQIYGVIRHRLHVCDAVCVVDINVISYDHSGYICLSQNSTMSSSSSKLTFSGVGSATRSCVFRKSGVMIGVTVSALAALLSGMYLMLPELISHA